ncbi:gelsolin-related protein of 125 kDa-like [Ostrinia furnacalis]|uniref:gelsolin-related protein of 125 kDa-like n=1 Tax=Ostrinia furnacalis TaxID=93504 RepID=UPI00103E9CA5|nr:gelsolin-related protein of 125 kDa-like [Ostrinia furnacalis]
MTDIIWDHRPFYVYDQTDPETFKVIEKRYLQFLDNVNDVTTEPVTVFHPLGSRQMEELTLIREVSKELQTKKEEDIKKSQQAAETEEKKEEVKEEEVKEKEEVKEADDEPAKKTDA